MTRTDAAIPHQIQGPLQAACLDADTAVALHGDAWKRLAQATDQSTFFMWPAVFDAWRHELASDVTANVIVVQRGTQMMGVLPVMQATVWRGPAFVPRIDYAPGDRDLAPGGMRAFPVRQVSSVVSWRATALRPTLLCAPLDRVGVIGAVTRVLATLRGVDQIVMPVHAAEDALWMEGFQQAGLAPWCHQLQRQVLTLEKVRPFDDLVAGQSANFRKNVRRARTAAADAGLAFTLYEGHDAVLTKLDAFARLADESWKATGTTEKTGIPYAGLQRNFFERVFRDRASGMTPVLAMGAVDGQHVAAALCMQQGSKLMGLLTFRNDLHPTASPGLLGMAILVDYAAARGLQTFDLNATQDWMRHISDSSHMLVNVAAFRPTWRGRLYDIIARTRRRAHPDAAT